MGGDPVSTDNSPVLKAMSAPIDEPYVVLEAGSMDEGSSDAGSSTEAADSAVAPFQRVDVKSESRPDAMSRDELKALLDAEVRAQETKRIAHEAERVAAETKAALEAAANQLIVKAQTGGLEEQPAIDNTDANAKTIAALEARIRFLEAQDKSMRASQPAKMAGMQPTSKVSKTKTDPAKAEKNKEKAEKDKQKTEQDKEKNKEKHAQNTVIVCKDKEHVCCSAEPKLYQWATCGHCGATEVGFFHDGGCGEIICLSCTYPIPVQPLPGVKQPAVPVRCNKCDHGFTITRTNKWDNSTLKAEFCSFCNGGGCCDDCIAQRLKEWNAQQSMDKTKVGTMVRDYEDKMKEAVETKAKPSVTPKLQTIQSLPHGSLKSVSPKPLSNSKTAIATMDTPNITGSTKQNAIVSPTTEVVANTKAIESKTEKTSAGALIQMPSLPLRVRGECGHICEQSIGKWHFNAKYIGGGDQKVYSVVTCSYCMLAKCTLAMMYSAGTDYFYCPELACQGVGVCPSCAKLASVQIVEVHNELKSLMEKKTSDVLPEKKATDTPKSEMVPGVLMPTLVASAGPKTVAIALQPEIAIPAPVEKNKSEVVPHVVPPTITALLPPIIVAGEKVAPSPKTVASPLLPQTVAPSKSVPANKESIAANPVGAEAVRCHQGHVCVHPRSQHAQSFFSAYNNHSSGTKKATVTCDDCSEGSIECINVSNFFFCPAPGCRHCGICEKCANRQAAEMAKVEALKEPTKEDLPAPKVKAAQAPKSKPDAEETPKPKSVKCAKGHECETSAQRFKSSLQRYVKVTCDYCHKFAMQDLSIVTANYMICPTCPDRGVCSFCVDEQVEAAMANDAANRFGGLIPVTEKTDTTSPKPGNAESPDTKADTKAETETDAKKETESKLSKEKAIPAVEKEKETAIAKEKESALSTDNVADLDDSYRKWCAVRPKREKKKIAPVVSLKNWWNWNSDEVINWVISVANIHDPGSWEQLHADAYADSLCGAVLAVAVDAFETWLENLDAKEVFGAFFVTIVMFALRELKKAKPYPEK
jgi:hypothetical protein